MQIPAMLKGYVPAPSSEGSPPHFRNTRRHFQIYLELRKQTVEGLRYRRDRQTDMVKWVAIILPLFVGGLFTFAGKATTAIPSEAKFLIGIAGCAIALLVALRIIHDAGQMACECAYVAEMDKFFGIRIPNGKIGSRLMVSCPFTKGDHDWCPPNWRPHKGGLSEVLLTPIVAIYLSFIFLLTIIFATSLWLLP